MATPLTLIQGTLDLLVLNALVFGPKHGYEVARWVRDTTGGTFELEDGALYTSLHRMEQRGWVGAEWGVAETRRRAKFYSLTSAGRKALNAERRDWARYVEAVFKVLQAAEVAV